MSHGRRPSRVKGDGYDDIRFEGEINPRDFAAFKRGRLIPTAVMSGERDPGFIPQGACHKKFVRCPGCGGKVIMPCVLCTTNASPHVTRITQPRRKNAAS